jgi:hypothetical protein
MRFKLKPHHTPSSPKVVVLRAIYKTLRRNYETASRLCIHYKNDLRRARDMVSPFTVAWVGALLAGKVIAVAARATAAAASAR